MQVLGLARGLRSRIAWTYRGWQSSFSDLAEGQLQLEKVEVADKAIRCRIRAKRPEVSDDPVDPLPDEEPPLPPPAPAPPEVSTCTLCMGFPLRSKKGREVYGAVQAMVNKLESFGFPVHRYHADRAQELKSNHLRSWLREKGVHTTWPPVIPQQGTRLR